MKQCFEANQVEIRVNLNTLEATTVFPYLGRKVTFNNSDWAELYRKMRKSQRRWGMVEKVLGNTGAPIKSQVMM